MSTNADQTKRLAGGAAVVAVGALAAAGFFWMNQDDEPSVADAAPPAADAPADPSAGTATDGAATDLEPDATAATDDGDPGDKLVADAEELPLPEDCHLHVNRSILASDPMTAAGFAKIGLTTSTIAPAQSVGANSHALFVRNTTRVDCDLTQGVIGMRGGIKFALGEQVVELRRTRVDLSDGTLVVYPRSTGSDSFVGSRIDSAEIERIESPDEVTVVIPLRFTAELTEVFNEGLGQPLAVEGGVVGSLTISASNHFDPLKNPDAHN